MTTSAELAARVAAKAFDKAIEAGEPPAVAFAKVFEEAYAFLDRQQRGRERVADLLQTFTAAALTGIFASTAPTVATSKIPDYVRLAVDTAAAVVTEWKRRNYV